MITSWIEILSSYDFEVEFRAEKKSGNADALSRCENPQDCKCPDMVMSEPLKCGPCHACRRRAETMLLENSGNCSKGIAENQDSVQINDQKETTDTEMGIKLVQLVSVKGDCQ